MYRISILLAVVALCSSTIQAKINPCTAGKNIIFDGKTYGTRYVTEIPGQGPALTGANVKVKANVAGTLTDGSTFWNSSTCAFAPCPPFAYTFNATVRHLIVGFDVGSYGMKVGETRKLCIPYNEGYGPKGKPPVIPPSATLIFELTCLSIGN